MFYASFYCFKTDFSITYTFVFIYFFVGQNVNMYLCNTVWRHKMTHFTFFNSYKQKYNFGVCSQLHLSSTKSLSDRKKTKSV